MEDRKESGMHTSRQLGKKREVSLHEAGLAAPLSSRDCSVTQVLKQSLVKKS